MQGGYYYYYYYFMFLIMGIIMVKSHDYTKIYFYLFICGLLLLQYVAMTSSAVGMPESQL